MQIQILIPTYNRAQWLEKNLINITSIINKLNLSDKVGIIISNNCSPDNTNEIVNDLIQKNNNISINLFNQETNIGLEKNALFVLKKASSDYIMFMGDDDFFSEGYLARIILEIEKDSNLSCIIPSFREVTTSGNYIPNVGRDLNLKTTYYKKGFSSCLNLSWRGHQLSGIVLRKNSLYDEYIKNKVHNLYPFIYFVALSTLNGNSIHLTDFPINVTRTTQNNKNWGYGNDGLVANIYDNYMKLHVNCFKRAILEIRLLTAQGWRLARPGIKKIPITSINIIINPNTSLITKVSFPLVLIWIFPRLLSGFIVRRLRKNNFN